MGALIVAFIVEEKDRGNRGIEGRARNLEKRSRDKKIELH